MGEHLDIATEGKKILGMIVVLFCSNQSHSVSTISENRRIMGVKGKGQARQRYYNKLLGSQSGLCRCIL